MTVTLSDEQFSTLHTALALADDLADFEEMEASDCGDEEMEAEILDRAEAIHAGYALIERLAAER